MVVAGDKPAVNFNARHCLLCVLLFILCRLVL